MSGRVTRVVLSSCALFASVAAGCGSGYETAPVHGQVTCDGKPVPGGTVYFAPAAEETSEPGRGATGVVDENGNYTLSTFGPNDGAIVGRHYIRYVKPDPAGLQDEVESLEGGDDPQDLADAKAQLEIAKKLASVPCSEPENTEAVVVAGDNEIDIELVKQGPRRPGDDEDD